MINRCYPIAIDGTQKLVREGRWYAEGEWLEWEFETRDGERVQQYVYVLEANLVFHNGLTLPLLSEFLSYDEGDLTDKQDSDGRLHAASQGCHARSHRRFEGKKKGPSPCASRPWSAQRPHATSRHTAYPNYSPCRGRMILNTRSPG